MDELLADSDVVELLSEVEQVLSGPQMEGTEGADTPKDKNMEQEKESDNQDLAATVEKLRRDLDNAKSEVAVADYLKESLLQTERQKESLQEEMATLQALLLEATQGQQQESQLMKMRKRAKALESENQDLKIQLRMSEGRRNSARVTPVATSAPTAGLKSPLSSSNSLAAMDKDSLLGSAAVISDRTKNMVRKMKSTVVQSFPAGAQSEEEFKKNQESEHLLRALVIPLEEQIVALKGKLRETDSLLQTYEKRQAQTLLEMEVVGEWLAGEQDTKKLEQRLTTAAGDGYSEETGQLYHAILAARIAMLSQDLQVANIQVESLQSSLAEAVSQAASDDRQAASGDRQAASSEQPAAAQQLITSILEWLPEEQRQQINENFGGEIEKLEKPQAATAKIVVSSEEWERMKTTLDSSKKGEDTEKLKEDMIIINKEKETLVKERDALFKEREHLQKNCSNYKEDLAKEAAFRKEMEATWNTRGVEYREHVESLQTRLRSDEEKLEKLSVAFLKLKEESRLQLSKLTMDRENIVKELRTIQIENDTLVGRHSELAQTMNNEVINLPDSVEDLHLLVLQYREDLITSKVGKERAQEKLDTEVKMMKQYHHQYNVNIKDLEEKMRVLEPTYQLLEAERAKTRELEEKIGELENVQSQTKLQTDKDMEVARMEKESWSAHNNQMKTKIISLQNDLDNSVAVQNDFVRLSQNLQMELEKIRQSEKEVRWQHEDDVTECAGCNTQLVANKKKQNCRHCGKIFCQSCLQKKVTSGPSGRQVAVCDVCHTLLVQNTAPYFASDTSN